MHADSFNLGDAIIAVIGVAMAIRAIFLEARDSYREKKIAEEDERKKKLFMSSLVR
jgi:hypothetical protein